MPDPEEVDPLTREVARRLTAAKEAAGLTFDQLGDRTGFGRASVVRWLKGERSPQVRDFYRLCEVLNIDPREVLAGAERSLRQ
jgi:transcriptional regulator with XRE-family HTH domain